MHSAVKLIRIGAGSSAYPHSLGPGGASERNQSHRGDDRPRDELHPHTPVLCLTLCYESKAAGKSRIPAHCRAPCAIRHTPPTTKSRIVKVQLSNLQCGGIRMNPRPLRVLVVDDSANDAELIIAELQRGGYDVSSERVQTAGAMREALGRVRWDMVVSDYSMPTFSGPAALEVLKATGQDLPFIIVSGTIGEESAVAALKAGAHDSWPRRASRACSRLSNANCVMSRRGTIGPAHTKPSSSQKPSTDRSLTAPCSASSDRPWTDAC